MRNAEWYGLPELHRRHESKAQLIRDGLRALEQLRESVNAPANRVSGRRVLLVQVTAFEPSFPQYTRLLVRRLSRIGTNQLVGAEFWVYPQIRTPRGFDGPWLVGDMYGANNGAGLRTMLPPIAVGDRLLVFRLPRTTLSPPDSGGTHIAAWWTTLDVFYWPGCYQA